MSDIPEPEISPAFTLEDIRKIRDWDAERYKGMTPKEICEDTRKRAEQYFASVKPADPAIMAETQRMIDEARERRANREKHKKVG